MDRGTPGQEKLTGRWLWDLYRTHPSTKSLRINLYGPGNRKVPLSIEQRRLSLDFMSTVRFGDGEAPKVGVWHVLEIWVEDGVVRLNLDGVHQLESRRDPVTEFLRFEMENETKKGTGPEGRIDLDFLLLD